MAPSAVPAGQNPLIDPLQPPASLYSYVTTTPQAAQQIANDVQAHDPHDKAIQVAQSQQKIYKNLNEFDAALAGTNQQPTPAKPKQEEQGFFDKIANALYLPAFNQGFNDLIVKPAAGATDFIDRTIDKAYQGVTGSKTPDWLRKKGAFDNLSNDLQRAYDERDKPSNIVSETMESTVGTLPLIASMFTGGGEANLATKAPQFVSKVTKLLATTGAANAYKEATDEGKGYTESLAGAAVGGEKGAIQGLTLDAQMLLGGALGKGVVNKLVEKGLLKGGKAGEALVHAIANGTVFGGTSAGEDLLQGRDINTHEAAKQFGMGLAFEMIPVAQGLKEEIGNHIEKSDINKKAAQNASLVAAASNLNGEAALRTLMTTPKEQLLAIHDNIPESHETLYANSIEQGMKAYDEKNLSEKKALYADQMLLKTQGDVKLIVSKLKDNSQEVIQSITESPELTNEQKTDLLDKVQSLTPQNEQATSNQEVPVEAPSNESVKTQEPVKAIDETGGDNKVTFKTSKGSTYVVNDNGSTTRNKASRSDIGHEGDFGEKEPSVKTYYVSEEDAGKLAEIQNTHPEKRRIEETEDGRIGVKYKTGKDAGKFEGRTVIKPSLEPKVGLRPLEIFSDGKEHFGNEITEVNEPAGNIEEPVRAKIPDSEAPTLPEVARNLKEVGEPGISVEPSFERAYEKPHDLTDNPLDNGQKYVVSRDKDGKVNGALEISYQSKDGIEKDPQSVKVVVDEGSRRQGIATKLFQHAEEQGIDLSKVRGQATTDAGQALYESSKKTPSTENLRKLGDVFKNRFGTNYKIIKPEEAEKILSENNNKEVFFQILDDVDVFNSTNQEESKKFINKVFQTVDNAAEAKSAYRKLAVKFHPDKGGHVEVMKYLNEVKEKYDAGKLGGSPKGADVNSARYDDFTKATEDFMKNQSAKNAQDFSEFQTRQRERQQKKQAILDKRDAAIAKFTQEISDYQKHIKTERDAALAKIEKGNGFFSKKVSDQEKAAQRREVLKKYAEAHNNSFDQYKRGLDNYHKLAFEAIQRVDKEYGFKFQKGEAGKVGAFYDKKTNTAYFIDGLSLDTSVIHEMFSHPFINTIEAEHPELFQNILKEAKSDKQVLDHVDKNYADADDKTREHEYIAAAIDLQAKGELKNKTLIQYINEFWNHVKDKISKLIGNDVANFDKNTSIKDLVDFILKTDEKLNLKPKGENTNAIPEQKPNEVGVRESGTVGEEMGARDAEPKKPAGEGEPSLSVQENEEAPLTSPGDINRKSIESETNPDNIASRYHEESNGADTKEQAIIDYLGNSKINEKDYNRWGDSKRLGDHTDPKRLRWIDSKNSDKTDLATHAEIISHEIGQQVTPEDIIDVVDKYKGKADFVDKNKTPVQKMLEEKYLDMTGKKLTSSAAEKAFNEKMRERAQSFIENAKELAPDERKEADELLAPNGITIKDIENYESELQQQPGGSGEPAPAENNAEVVQQPEDEHAADAGENTGGKEPQGQPVANEKQAAILKEIEDAKKEFKDFIKSSRKNINSVGGALGASFEFVGKAGKLLAAYSKLGIYKFGEFIDKVRADFGDEFAEENINGFRSAYAAMRDGADKKERAKFDDSDAVDDYIANASKNEPVAPVIERDAVSDLKDAGKNKAVLEKAVAKDAPKDELLKEFASLDPRYFTPDEVAAYNELTKDKSPSNMQRDAIAKFIDDFHERQADDAEKRQADWYKQIQEDDELSQAEAKKVLDESAETTDAQPDLENTEQDKKAKNAFSKIITQYKKELRGADVPTDMGDVKKALLEVDETKLSTRQAREIAKVMDGILYDGNYAGAGKAVALSKAVENAKAIAADLEKRGFDKGDISQFWADFRTLDQNVEMIAKSSKGASVIQNKAGIQDISAGNAKVNKLANDLSKAYDKLTAGMGGKILNVENRYKRGMLASILQVADNDLPSDSFERYKNYIKETGEILSRSKIKVEQKEGELVTKLYNQFMDGKEDAAAVIEAITKDNPNNTRIVNFFVKQFEPIYGDLRRNTLLYQGKDLPFIQQYTPTQMKRLRGYDELATPEVSITDPISFNGMDEPTDTKSARTTIARKPLKTLKGTKRVLNLDFDGLALNKYRESNYDIQTMESRHLFDNIRKLGDFKSALGGNRNVNVISNGVSNMVLRQKGFNRTSPEARAAIQLLNVVSGKGVRIALQGTAQFLKQYPSVGLNTLANLGTDMDLYFKSIARFGLHDPIFDQSGIGLRASQHGGTSFELDLRKVQNTDFSGPVIKALSKMTQFGDKMNKVFSYALTTADDAVARNSWGAYYMQDLRKQGVDLDAVDWSSEHKNINKEAAAYAEQMVSRNQIQNDPSKQANFLYGGGVESGKDLGSVVLKGLAFPFSSFARNAQARLESDLRKFSGGDRKEATVSIISGIAEAAAFNALKIAIIGTAVNAGAAAILPKFGFNQPADKDLADRAKQIPAQALNDVLLSGFGAMADNMIVKGLNRVANPNEDKKLAQWLVPNYDPGRYGEPDFGLAGIYGVLPGKLYQLQQEANYIDGQPTGEAYDSHKKEVVKYQSQLTERQQNMAQMVFAIDVLGVLGVSDAEILRLNQKLYREMAKEKAPVKFHSGYNKNSKAKPIVVK